MKGRRKRLVGCVICGFELLADELKAWGSGEISQGIVYHHARSSLQ